MVETDGKIESHLTPYCYISSISAASPCQKYISSWFLDVARKIDSRYFAHSSPNFTAGVKKSEMWFRFWTSVTFDEL